MKTQRGFNLLMAGILVIAGLLLGLALKLQEMDQEEEATLPTTYYAEWSRYIRVAIDPLTGCHYLLYHDTIYPRVDAEGGQHCEVTK